MKLTMTYMTNYCFGMAGNVIDELVFVPLCYYV